MQITPPYGRKWRRAKEPLNESEKESEKVGLKLNIQKTKILASGPITLWQIDGETMETLTDLIFLGSKITENGDCSHETKRHLLLERKAMWDLDSVLKNTAITLLTKVPIVKAMHSVGISFPFSSSHVRMWEVNHREGWVLKNWCFWTVVLEENLESPLDLKEIKPPILWSPVLKSWLIGKDPDAGKDWGQKKGMTENEMVEWHNQFNGHEFEQTLGDSER